MLMYGAEAGPRADEEHVLVLGHAAEREDPRRLRPQEDPVLDAEAEEPGGQLAALDEG